MALTKKKIKKAMNYDAVQALVTALEVIAHNDPIGVEFHEHQEIATNALAYFEFGLNQEQRNKLVANKILKTLFKHKYTFEEVLNVIKLAEKQFNEITTE